MEGGGTGTCALANARITRVTRLTIGGDLVEGVGLAVGQPDWNPGRNRRRCAEQAIFCPGQARTPLVARFRRCNPSRQPRQPDRLPPLWLTLPHRKFQQLVGTAWHSQPQPPNLCSSTPAASLCQSRLSRYSPLCGAALSHTFKANVITFVHTRSLPCVSLSVAFLS